MALYGRADITLLEMEKFSFSKTLFSSTLLAVVLGFLIAFATADWG